MLSTKRNAIMMILIFLIIFIASCKHYHFRVIVQDQEDNPIPGAIVYIESYDQKGAIDFTWVKTGDSIEVPLPGQPEILLNGSNETKIAIAVFAKGKNPLVMFDHSGVLKPEMWEYMLEDAPIGGFGWEPKLAQIQFPFIHQFDLHDKLKFKEYEPLIKAFKKAYKPLEEKIATRQALVSEIEKYNYLYKKINDILIKKE